MLVRPALAHPTGRGSGVGAAPYIPRVALRHLAQGDLPLVRETDATAVFADVSGFTRLSERLSRQGREGAELLAGAIDRCFTTLLATAYANGGSLLKFGGDALLLLFEGEQHAERACRAAIGMHEALRAMGPVLPGTAPVTLRMSTGVNSGVFQLFVAGSSHRELVVTGPAVTAAVAAEHAACAGEIILSETTAARIPAGSVGRRREGGVLLRRDPGGPDHAPPAPEPATNGAASFLSTAVRAHVLEADAVSEHRVVTVAFLRFSGSDRLIQREGAALAADVLQQTIDVAQRAADDHGVCFLCTDVDVDGGKIILTGGAPRAQGDDEARVLCATRRVLEEPLALPVRAGVHRGFVFAGDIGPSYRRTYTVMGDAVNLAARLMAKAGPGRLYASPDVLQRSTTRFAMRALKPFMVKGKRRPVQAFSVGRAAASETMLERHAVRPPLIGRDAELALIEGALEAATEGRGVLLDVIAEAGIGGGRLVAELRERAHAIRDLGVRCDPSTSTTPYAAWRDILRTLAGIAEDATDAEAAAQLQAHVAAVDPALQPWLALLGIPFGLELPATPEVEDLAEEFRHGKVLELAVALLRRHTATPLLLRFESAHHMDAASAELLAALAESLRDARWLVAVTRRESDRGFAAPDHPAVRVLDLNPLTARQTLELAEALTEHAPLPPHVVHAAAERSAGNPRALQQLLVAAAEGDGELPDTIEAAAIARIDRLAAADRALVRRASVLGPRFEERLLSGVVEDPPRAGDPVWQRLAGVLEREPGGHVRFMGADLCEAAYGGLPYGLRRALHAAVADRLASDDHREDVFGQLSYHLALAGQPGEAWGYARLAARHAAAGFAFVDAAALHERAIQAARSFPVPRNELVDEWEALGRARALSGELTQGIRDLRRARRLAAGDPLRRAELAHHEALAQVEAGALVAAASCVRRALQELREATVADERRWRVELLSVLASVRYRQGRMKVAARLAREVLEDAAGEEHASAIARAHSVIGVTLLQAGGGDPRPHFEVALALHRTLGELDLESRVLGNLAVLAYREARWSEAATLWEAAAAAAQRAGDVSNAAVSELNLGELWSDQGRLEDGEASLRRALRTLRGTGRDQAAAYATLMLGRLCARAGRLDEARQLLGDAREETLDRDARFELDLADALLAELCVFERRPAEALEICGSITRGGGLRQVPVIRRVCGAALAQRGETAAAREALETSLALAREQGAEYEAALTLDVLAQLEGGEGPRAERDELLERLGVASLSSYPV